MSSSTRQDRNLRRFVAISLCLIFIVIQWIITLFFGDTGYQNIMGAISLLLTSEISEIVDFFKGLVSRYVEDPNRPATQNPYEKGKVYVTTRDLLFLLFLGTVMSLFAIFFWRYALSCFNLWPLEAPTGNPSPEIKNLLKSTYATFVCSVGVTLFGTYGVFRGFNEGIIHWGRLWLSAFIGYTAFLLLNAAVGAEFFSSDSIQKLFTLPNNSLWLTWYIRIPTVIGSYLVLLTLLATFVWIASCFGKLCSQIYSGYPQPSPGSPINPNGTP